MIFHITYYFIPIHLLFLSVPFSLCIYPFPSTPFLFAVHHTILCRIIFPPLTLSISFSFSCLFGRSPSCFPLSKGNPLSPLFPQCDAVLEFSTTYSICYCDSVKVAPLYDNNGLQHTLTTVESCTQMEYTRFTNQERWCSTNILDLYLGRAWVEYLPGRRLCLRFLLRGFPRSVQENAGKVPRWRCDRFLPNSFCLITYQCYIVWDTDNVAK
jgi:hypothetical protein